MHADAVANPNLKFHPTRISECSGMITHMLAVILLLSRSMCCQHGSHLWDMKVFENRMIVTACWIVERTWSPGRLQTP
jgi:hypothetical protein